MNGIVFFVLGIISIEAANINNVTNTASLRETSASMDLDNFNMRNLDKFELPTFTFNSSQLLFKEEDSLIYAEGILGIKDDSNCEFGGVMVDSIYYRYYFRPSYMDVMTGERTHFMLYCLEQNPYNLRIAKFTQLDKSHTKFTFLLYTDQTFGVKLSENTITVGCDAVTLKNVYYDYSIVNGIAKGKCIEFYYSKKEITRRCKSDGQWEDVTSDMECYLQTKPVITPSASELSVSFNSDKSKIILNGKITLTDSSNCPANHIDHITYFYSFTHANGQLPQKNDPFMKNKTIPYCFENNIITFDFDVDNSDITKDRFNISIYANENQQYLLGTVIYYLKCEQNHNYNAYWPSGYVGTIQGTCNILHIWNNNNNPSRLDYPNRICYPNNNWEVLSEGCIPFKPQINFDYNETTSFFNSNNITTVNGKLYIDYITECHLINETVASKFYMIISSDVSNEVTFPIDSCLTTNRTYITLNNYKATKLYSKLCYDKSCNYVLKDTDTHIYSCPYIVENNIHYKPTISGDSVNITSKDCLYFYAYGGGLYNTTSFIRKCDGVLGWELSNELCSPMKTDFKFDLSGITASLDNDFIILNGDIKIIDGNNCNYPSKPSSLYVIYDISSSNDISTTSSTGISKVIPYCFNNNNQYVIPLNNYKGRNQNEFNLNIKLCTSKTECTNVNLLSKISKPFGCIGSTNDNYIFTSSLIGDKEGRCKDFYEYTEKPPIIGKCNENGQWEYPQTGKCIIDNNYIKLLIDIDLSDLTASIDDKNDNKILILNGNVKLTDRYGCNSTYKPNQLTIQYALGAYMNNYGNAIEINTDYCFTNNVYNIKLTDYYGNNLDGVFFNIKVYNKNGGLEVGRNSRVFGCKPFTDKNNYIIWPVSLFGTINGECVPLYEFEISGDKPTRKCLTTGNWEDYDKKCIKNSNFVIDTSPLTTVVEANTQLTEIRGNITINDLNKGIATYQPKTVTFIYYYSDSANPSQYMNNEIVNKNYPFKTNHIETIDLSTPPYYKANHEIYDKLNMKLCLDKTCVYTYTTKSQILVCKKTNSNTINWKKTIVNTKSTGECIYFYHYPINNNILPPRLCKTDGIWDSYSDVCILMKFPKFDISVIDISSTSYSTTNLNDYSLQFKAKLVLKEHQIIPSYGQIRLYCKLDNQIGENSDYVFYKNINYKNGTNVGNATYTDTINIRSNMNKDNHYLYLKLCINTKDDTTCKYEIQDAVNFYLKCESSSSSNATWDDSLVNTHVKGECNRKYIYNSNGFEPLRNCTINNVWDEPEGVCIRQTNPTFSYSWSSFKSSNLKTDSVTFEGRLVVNDNSSCLKYQKEIYYKWCFKDSGNNCDQNRQAVKTSYCFSNNKLQIQIPRTTVTNSKFYFFIQFCTNKDCNDDLLNNDKNEIISNYTKTIICLIEDLSKTDYRMIWPNTIPNKRVRIDCPNSPHQSYYNGVDEYPERTCNEYAEWEPLIYKCVIAENVCRDENHAYNNFPMSPSPRVYHSPCNSGYHNLIPRDSPMFNRSRRNCTGNGNWSEIENPCFSDDYKYLELTTDNVIIEANKNTNEFCIRGLLMVLFENRERKDDIYFMNIQVLYELNSVKTQIYEFQFNKTVGVIATTQLSPFCYNNTNQITFSLYFKDEDYTIKRYPLIAGCFSRKYQRNNFYTTTLFGKNSGYCDDGYISEDVPKSECKQNGEWGEISNICFYPDYRYYYLNLSNILIDVNETHFILTNQFSIEHNRTCDPIVYSVLLRVLRINISPVESDKTEYVDMKKLACVNDKLISNILIKNNKLAIKSTVTNTVSFGLFYSSESVNNATRILGCPNYNYKHNIFTTSLFGEKTGKCDKDYISQSPNGLPSNTCNENGKWNEDIKYPCFKPTYKQTKFNFTELKVTPKEDEFCLSGKILTDYYENQCGDVDTPFNLTIYYKFKNLDSNIYHYLDSFIYKCQKRVSTTIYTSPVCVPSNTTNEITYELRYGDEIITTESFVLGCNRISEEHNNFNTSLVGFIEGSCDAEYESESMNNRPIRECKSNGEWNTKIEYICIPTDYKYLSFDSSQSLIIIKDKNNFCLTNKLKVIYNRTTCSDVYSPLPINIMYQYANETINNTINTNDLHYFSNFLFQCKYGVISEHQYPEDFCISSKTSTYVTFVMMYKDNVITSQNIYLGCDELKDVDNQFDTSLIGKNEGKCNEGYISLSQNGKPQRECLSDGTWSEVTFPCIKDDYSLLRFNLQNLAITMNNKNEFCINGNLLSQYEGECDKYNYNLVIKLYYQLNGTGVENYYQDFIFDCRNGNYSVTKFKADLCIDSSLYNKIKFHLYYTNTHITDSLLNLGCMKQIVNGSEWQASLIGKSNGTCLSGYKTLNDNISHPIRECLYDGNYGYIIEPCVQIPSNEGFLTGSVKYAIFGISILLLLICLLLLCCCLLCYACDRTKKKHKKRVRNEANIDAEDEENDNEENENDNENNNEDDDKDEDNKDNCGTNVIFNDKNDIESIDCWNGSISGDSNNNLKKGILKKTSSKFGKKSSAISLTNNANYNMNNAKKSAATMYSMRTNQLHPSKSSNFAKNPNSNEPLRHFKSSHNVLRSNSKIAPSLPGSTSEIMNDNNLLGRTKSSTSCGFNPTFSTSNIGLSNPNMPALARTSSSNYNPRFTSATLGLSNPGSVVNSDNESSGNELLGASVSSLKKSNEKMNENIPPKYQLNKRQSIGRSISSAFPPPPQPQIQPPHAPSSSKTVRHYTVRGGNGPTRSVSCRIPKRVNKTETTEVHPFGVGSPIKRSKSTLFRENKSEISNGGPVRQISKKNSSKAMELDLEIEDLI